MNLKEVIKKILEYDLDKEIILAVSSENLVTFPSTDKIKIFDNGSSIRIDIDISREEK